MDYYDSFSDSDNRINKILDLIYLTFSDQDPDHSSLAPFVNLLRLLIQKQMVITIVAHSGKDRIENFKWSQHGRIIARPLGLSKAKNPTKSETIERTILKKAQEKIEKSIAAGTFESSVQITDSSSKRRIWLRSRFGRGQKRELKFRDLSVFFHWIKFDTVKNDVILEHIDEGYIAEISILLIKIRADTTFKEFIEKWVFDFFSENIRGDLGVRRDHLSDDGKFTPDFRYTSLVDKTSEELFPNAAPASLLNQFSVDFTTSNFLFCVKCAGKRGQDVARFVIPPQQRIQLADKLKLIASFQICDQDIAEIFDLAERHMIFDGTIEYGALPFGDMGFVNLQEAMNLVHPGGKRKGRREDIKRYRARRILFALVSDVQQDQIGEGSTFKSLDEIAAFGGGLALAVLPFHFVGAPYGYIVRVTRPYDNGSPADEDPVRWAQNLLMYSGFANTYARKFRARLRARIAAFIGSDIEKILLSDKRSKNDIGIGKWVLECLPEINDVLDNAVKYYPIKSYRLHAQSVQGDMMQADEEWLPVTVWHPYALHLSSEDSGYFERIFQKPEAGYSQTMRLTIQSAIERARSEILVGIEHAVRVYWRGAWEELKDYRIIVFICEREPYLGSFSWTDVAREWIGCIKGSASFGHRYFEDVDSFQAFRSGNVAQLREPIPLIGASGRANEEERKEEFLHQLQKNRVDYFTSFESRSHRPDLSFFQARSAGEAQDWLRAAEKDGYGDQVGVVDLDFHMSDIM